jgi:hypothetical protein
MIDIRKLWRKNASLASGRLHVASICALGGGWSGDRFAAHFVLIYAGIQTSKRLVAFSIMMMRHWSILLVVWDAVNLLHGHVSWLLSTNLRRLSSHLASSFGFWPGLAQSTMLSSGVGEDVGALSWLCHNVGNGV